MRLITAICVVLSFAVIGNTAPAQANSHKTTVKHHGLHAVTTPPADTTPQRVCDWIGPGARAVYRCRLVEPHPAAS